MGGEIGAVARVESRRRARLGGARRSAPRRAAALGAGSQHALRAPSRRCGSRTTSRTGSSGSTATITSTAWCRSCGAARDAADTVVAVVNFTPLAAPRLSHRRARAAARTASCLNSDAEVYGGSNIGNLGERAPPTMPAHGLRRSRSMLTVPPLGFLLLQARLTRRQRSRREATCVEMRSPSREGRLVGTATLSRGSCADESRVRGSCRSCTMRIVCAARDSRRTARCCHAGTRHVLVAVLAEPRCACSLHSSWPRQSGRAVQLRPWRS